MVSTKAPALTPGATSNTPYELSASAFGSLLHIATEVDTAFYGKRLVRAFLKNILYPTASGFVPHVPANFVEYCLSNPSSSMCQVCHPPLLLCKILLIGLILTFYI